MSALAVVSSPNAGNVPDPFPLNNGTQWAAEEPNKSYRMIPGKIGSIYAKHAYPMDPTGQTRHELSRRLVVQMGKTPKQSFQKAYTCGDHFELAEYFDAEMKPASFMYDFSLGKGEQQLFEEDVVLLELESDLQEYNRKRQELIDEGWPLEKVNEVFPPKELIEEPETEQEESDNAEENRARSLRRAKNNARRIIQNERFDMMWTFTFSPPPEYDFQRSLRADKLGITRFLSYEEQQDRNAVNNAWKAFLKRLKRSGIDGARWLKVLEVHDGKETCMEKRGAYHLHVATDLRIPKKDMQRLWSYGIVHFTDFTRDLYSADRNNSAAYTEERKLETNYDKDPSFYMTKYIEKDFDRAKESKEKAFTKSRNVKTPQVVRDRETIEEKKMNPLKAFELKGMCREIREALESAKMEDLKLFLPGSGIYPIEYQKWNPDAQEFQTVKGFVKKSFYNACLALPKYKKRYERFLEKKRKEQAANRQLSLF